MSAKFPRGGSKPILSHPSINRFLESTISKLATNENSFFQLVSVAGETGLSLALSETPKTGFLATRSIYCRFMMTL